MVGHKSVVRGLSEYSTLEALLDEKEAICGGRGVRG